MPLLRSVASRLRARVPPIHSLILRSSFQYLPVSPELVRAYSHCRRPRSTVADGRVELFEIRLEGRRGRGTRHPLGMTVTVGDSDAGHIAFQHKQISYSGCKHSCPLNRLFVFVRWRKLVI